MQISRPPRGSVSTIKEESCLGNALAQGINVNVDERFELSQFAWKQGLTKSQFSGS